MKNEIYPCLWLNGNAKEAADYYCSVFDNSTIISENPIVVMFEIENTKFMTLNGGPMFKINPSISFFVLYNDVDEINKIWNLLANSGKILMPLNKYAWSEKYGWCQDKFGVNWQLMMSKDVEQKIVPCLMFTQKQSGRAEEAMKFYTTIFKDAEIKTTSRYEAGERDVEGYIKNAGFTLHNQLFNAMDSSGAHEFTFNEAVSIVVPCNNQEEIDHYWYKLLDGGKEGQCGWLEDKFGVSWQIVPVILGKLMSDASKREKVVQAFMKMKKFDIKTLEQAYSTGVFI